MAWTAPMTAVVNEIWTADQWNTHVRDNLLETAPGIAATEGAMIFADGAHSLVEREWHLDHVPANETTSSNEPTDLATPGPEVTVTTGSEVLVHIQAGFRNDTRDAAAFVTYGVSGDTTRAAGSPYFIEADGMKAGSSSYQQYGAWFHEDSLTPGTNTFTMKYWVGSGTANYEYRRIQVLSL